MGDEVRDLGQGAAAVESLDPLLQPAILDGDALVLAQMLEPALELEGLEPAARLRGVLEEPPRDGPRRAAARGASPAWCS